MFQCLFCTLTGASVHEVPNLRSLAVNNCFWQSHRSYCCRSAVLWKSSKHYLIYHLTMTIMRFLCKIKMDLFIINSNWPFVLYLSSSVLQYTPYKLMIFTFCFIIHIGIIDVLKNLKGFFFLFNYGHSLKSK